jgi:hypothetical protein
VPLALPPQEVGELKLGTPGLLGQHYPALNFKNSKSCDESQLLASVSCTGDFSPNFDLKNMISTYTKDFSWKTKEPNLPDFEDFFFQIARFLW